MRRSFFLSFLYLSYPPAKTKGVKEKRQHKRHSKNIFRRKHVFKHSTSSFFFGEYREREEQNCRYATIPESQIEIKPRKLPDQPLPYTYPLPLFKLKWALSWQIQRRICTSSSGYVSTCGHITMQPFSFMLSQAIIGPHPTQSSLSNPQSRLSQNQSCYEQLPLPPPFSHLLLVENYKVKSPWRLS